MSDTTDHPAVPDSIRQQQIGEGTEETSQVGTHEDDQYPDPDELTPKQRETLQAIREHPDATQRELADRLDVTSPTISVRVNNIDGFDWENRQTFVESVFDDSGSRTDGDGRNRVDSDVADEIDDIAQQLESISETCNRLVSEPSESVDFDFDTGLGHKITHACMEASCITEEEEQRVLEMMIDG